MKIDIRVKPRAKRNEVKEEAGGGLLVCVTAPPVDGKANEQVIEVLATYFGIPKSTIRIKSGKNGRRKIVEIL